MSALGYFIDVPLLLITFYLMVKYREVLVEKLLRVPLSNYVLFLVTATVLIIIEENINSGFPYFIVPFVPWTVPILLVQVMVLAWIVNKWSVSVKKVLIGYVIFGVAWELLLGPLGQSWNEYPLWFMLWTVVFVGISYAYVAYIPLWLRKRA